MTHDAPTEDGLDETQPPQGSGEVVDGRALADGQKGRVIAIKAYGEQLHDLINIAVDDGREKSLAKTKVEEAVMWAVKGVTG